MKQLMWNQLVQQSAAFVIALLAITLAACGGDGNDTTPTPSASASRSATPDGSATPEPSPATTEAGIELDEFVIRPDTTRARPGTLVFTVRNAGDVAHQFVVIRSDLPAAQLPRRENNRGADEAELDVVDRIETIAPGDEADLNVAVEEGQYLLICNIVAGETSHYLSGMYTPFAVEATAPAPSP